MTGSALFAGIDVGTSGVRVVVIDAERRIVGEGSAKGVDHGSDHRSPDAWLKTLISAFGAAFANCDPRDVEAISVDGTSSTILAVTDDGEVVAEPMMYNDPVSDPAIVSAISDNGPDTSAAHGASSGLARSLFLQNADGCERLVHQADWVSGQLSGRFDLSDENNALKTGYDPVARRWPDWLDTTGIDRSKLPMVVEPGSVAASARGALAGRLGLRSETAIVAGTTDGCASFLATGANAPGDAVTALGTTLTIKLLCDNPIFSPASGIYSHRIGDRWLAGGASNTGGNVIAAHFNDTEIAQFSDRLDPLTSTGLDYYPLTRPGERFPHNDSEFQPRMTPRPQDKTMFFKAILEGITAVEILGYRKLTELGAPKPKTMRTVGGGAGNDAWTAMRQDRLAIPFETVLSEEAAMGTALLARKAMLVSP